MTHEVWQRRQCLVADCSPRSWSIRYKGQGCWDQQGVVQLWEALLEGPGAVLRSSTLGQQGG